MQVKTLSRAQPGLQGEIEATSREQENATKAYEREATRLQKELRAVEEEIKSVSDLSRHVQVFVYTPCHFEGV